MNENYLRKQAIRMRDYRDNNQLYLDAAYRLLSNADAIPTSYAHEGLITPADIQKAEVIAAGVLSG